jgi:hypothetical protein
MSPFTESATRLDSSRRLQRSQTRTRYGTLFHLKPTLSTIKATNREFLKILLSRAVKLSRQEKPARMTHFARQESFGGSEN